MPSSEDKIWKRLSKFNLRKISGFKDNKDNLVYPYETPIEIELTTSYWIFNFNINRLMRLYSILLNIKRDTFHIF